MGLSGINFDPFYLDDDLQEGEEYMKNGNSHGYEEISRHGFKPFKKDFLTKAQKENIEKYGEGCEVDAFMSAVEKEVLKNITAINITRININIKYSHFSGPDGKSLHLMKRAGEENDYLSLPFCEDKDCGGSFAPIAILPKTPMRVLKTDKKCGVFGYFKEIEGVPICEKCFTELYEYLNSDPFLSLDYKDIERHGIEVVSVNSEFPYFDHSQKMKEDCEKRFKQTCLITKMNCMGEDECIFYNEQKEKKIVKENEGDVLKEVNKQFEELDGRIEKMSELYKLLIEKMSELYKLLMGKMDELKEIIGDGVFKKIEEMEPLTDEIIDPYEVETPNIISFDLDRFPLGMRVKIEIDYKEDQV